MVMGDAFVSRVGSFGTFKESAVLEDCLMMIKGLV